MLWNWANQFCEIIGMGGGGGKMCRNFSLIPLKGVGKEMFAPCPLPEDL